MLTASIDLQREIFGGAFNSVFSARACAAG